VYAGTFVLEGRHLTLPAARGCPPLALRLSRPVPYAPASVRSVTVLNVGPKLFVDVTAEVPVATYEEGTEPDPARVAGVDLGIIHPYAVVGPRAALLVSGRAGSNWPRRRPGPEPSLAVRQSPAGGPPAPVAEATHEGARTVAGVATYQVVLAGVAAAGVARSRPAPTNPATPRAQDQRKHDGRASTAPRCPFVPNVATCQESRSAWSPPTRYLPQPARLSWWVRGKCSPP
jgi:hypothetical protein